MKKRTLHFLTVCGVLAALALASLLVSLSLSGTLESQKAAERWRGENEQNFAQLSCFMSGDDSLRLGDIYAFRRTLLDSLTEASFTAPENGSLFRDAWSAFGTLSVSGEHGSGTANAVAVGGDFFFFHPLRLVSGGYLREDDVMDDRVLLDRELAWRLFGGDNLAGMTVMIGEKPYVVAGVVDRDGDFASRKARQEGMTLYMSYSAWNAMAGEGGAKADCYELVMPQPVEGFAESLVKEKFPLGKGELINNSGRFSLVSGFQVLREFGSRSMHLNNVIYPEWENAARCLGDWCALFLALAAAFAALPAAAGFAALMILLIRLKDFLSAKLPALFSSALERARQKRWEKRHG